MIISDKKSTNVLVSSDHGLMIVNRFDGDQNANGHGAWLLDHGNGCVPEAFRSFEILKERPNPVIFDVGANIGCFTTLLARVLPNSTIHAFEPQRHVFQMLSGNIAINNFYNVHTINCAVSNYNGTLDIEEPDPMQPCDFGTYSLVHQNTYTPSGRKRVCDVITLDKYVEKHNIERVDFIKIDVEGMDIDVLEGARKIIEAHKPTLFVEHITPYTSIKEQLQSIDFLQKYTFHYDERNVLLV